jgi:Ala-tRNA(Pro) deacylase
MTLNARLQAFLNEARTPYRTLGHREAFTAQEVAAASHVPGRDLAKVVLVRTDAGQHLMAVLPASCRLDLSALAETAGARRLTLVTEEELRRLFPDCEAGAMPPFGGLYELPVYVDACFPRGEELFFQAGNHHEVVGMPYVEFERLAKPRAGEFCLHAREPVH